MIVTLANFLFNHNNPDEILLIFSFIEAEYETINTFELKYNLIVVVTFPFII